MESGGSEPPLPRSIDSGPARERERMNSPARSACSGAAAGRSAAATRGPAACGASSRARAPRPPAARSCSRTGRTRRGRCKPPSWLRLGPLLFSWVNARDRSIDGPGEVLLGRAAPVGIDREDARTLRAPRRLGRARAVGERRAGAPWWRRRRARSASASRRTATCRNTARAKPTTNSSSLATQPSPPWKARESPSTRDQSSEKGRRPPSHLPTHTTPPVAAPRRAAPRTSPLTMARAARTHARATTCLLLRW